VPVTDTVDAVVEEVPLLAVVGVTAASFVVVVVVPLAPGTSSLREPKTRRMRNATRNRATRATRRVLKRT
jgi:heme exporter protein D